MAATESVEHPGGAARVEAYACECGRKAVVMFEHKGGLTEDEQGWVEREVARRGSFFPGDYGGGGPRFGT